MSRPGSPIIKSPSPKRNLSEFHLNADGATNANGTAAANASSKKIPDNIIASLEAKVAEL